MASGLRRAIALVARYEAWLICGAVLCIVLRLALNARRRFWFDELFTFYISRLPRLDQVFQAIPADGNPPLNYLLVRVCLRLFGETEIATRLPSILAFAGASLATYFFVRRHSGALPALFGMFILATGGMAAAGSEARPYALLLGFTGLTMVSWQAATAEGRTRLIPLAGVAAGIAGAIASHHYGSFYVGIPLAFGEAIRLVQRRRLDMPLYAAWAAGLCVIVFTAPFALETHRIMLNYVRDSVSFWAKPTIRSIGAYRYLINVPLLFVFGSLLALTRILFRRGVGTRKSAGSRDSVPAHEIAAALGLALLVPIMVGITWMATGYFLPRYAIGASMGVAILAGLAAQHLGWNPDHGSALALLCMAVIGLGSAGSGIAMLLKGFMKSPAAVERANPDTALDRAIDGAIGEEPIVIASALTYMPAWWYAPPELRKRLHYLADLPFAVRQPDFLPEFSLVVNQQFVPSRPDDYRQFLLAHHSFLLYCVGDRNLEWTKMRLRREGWTFQSVRRDERQTLFLVQSPAL